MRLSSELSRFMETGICCCLLKLTIVFFATISSEVNLKVNANEILSDKKYESIQKLKETSKNTGENSQEPLLAVLATV